MDKQTAIRGLTRIRLEAEALPKVKGRAGLLNQIKDALEYILTFKTLEKNNELMVKESTKLFNRVFAGGTFAVAAKIGGIRNDGSSRNGDLT